MDGSEDFYRTFSEYERGFGKLSGEFWLGEFNWSVWSTSWFFPFIATYSGTCQIVTTIAGQI